MKKTVIKAEVVADSINQQGDRLTSLRITFPRIILAEVNTHRMLSKNTSSSRAIPFKKMVESVENDPFIPIAWQKPHKGMQGTEYYNHTLTEEVGGLDYTNLPRRWLRARDTVVSMAKIMVDERGNMPVTKQLANRLLEPFMWTTMLITGSKEGWDNFFNLRCPIYKIKSTNINGEETDIQFKSRKDFINYVEKYDNEQGSGNEQVITELKNYTDLDWLQINQGQAEIHMMDLAEKIYDTMNESIPKQLKSGEWHIPFENNLDVGKVAELYYEVINNDRSHNHESSIEETKVKISTAMAARVSYTVVGNEKGIDYQKQLELHDRLISQDPPHSSCLEHCNRAMSDEEYQFFIKGKGIPDYNLGISSSNPVLTFRENEKGWCNNIKGFIPYRYMIDNNLKM